MLLLDQQAETDVILRISGAMPELYLDPSLHRRGYAHMKVVCVLRLYGRNPFGVEEAPPWNPGQLAKPSQPWAVRRNAFGIKKDLSKAQPNVLGWQTAGALPLNKYSESVKPHPSWPTNPASWQCLTTYPRAQNYVQPVNNKRRQLHTGKQITPVLHISPRST